MFALTVITASPYPVNHLNTFNHAVVLSLFDKYLVDLNPIIL